MVSGPVHVGGEMVESVLIFSGVILIADVYNLVLTYQQNPAIVKTSLYRGLSIFQALVIICLLVLSWSHPAAVLLPRTVTVWNLIFILLAGIKGLVGNFFAVTARYIPFPPKQEFMIWLGTINLFCQGLLCYPLLVIHGGGRWLMALVVAAVIVVGLWAEFIHLPLIFSTGFVQRSGIYQCIVGINLIASVAVLFFGLDTVIFRLMDNNPDLISGAFVTAWLLQGVSQLAMGAMHHYDNDYRYGHAIGRERLYVLLGTIVGAILLLAACFWLAWNLKVVQRSFALDHFISRFLLITGQFLPGIFLPYLVPLVGALLAYGGND